MHIAKSEKIKKTFAFNVDIFKPPKTKGSELTFIQESVIIFVELIHKE